MKVKKLIAVLCTAFALALCFAFAACAPKEPEPTPATEYTVTFDANGGTLTGNASVKVESGKTVSGAPTAAKAEHDFDGWYTLATDGDKIELATYKVTKDITLYAHYKAKSQPVQKVEVTFDANGGVIEGDTKIEVDENGNIFDLPEATRSGYRFDAWYDKADGGNVVDPMFDAITESVTLYAHWIKQYTVTFDAGAGVLEGESSLTVDEDSILPAGIPSASKAGNEFHGWYTAAEGGDKIDFATYKVVQDVTLHAHYGYFSMPIKTLKSSDETQNIGYTLEAEDSKFTVSIPEFLQQWMGNNPVENVANASGGKSLGFMSEAGKTVMFAFKAETAGKGTLYLRATSAITDGQNGPIVDVEVSSAKLGVSINETDKPYTGGTVRGSNQANVYNMYWDSVPVGEFDIVAGNNTIILTVKQQAINLDCIDIHTTVNLTSVNGAAASGESVFPAPPAPAVVYDKDVAVKLIVGGYEGGPAVEKAILTFVDDIPATAVAESNPFAVVWGESLGGNTDKVYLCDATGAKLAESATASKYVAIEYAVSYGQWSFNGNLSPFTYNQQTSKNLWKDISTVKVALNELTIGETTYTKFGGNVTATKEIPCLTDWKLDGTFTDTIQWGTPAADRTINLTYGAYEPEALKTDSGKNALIVWLHGGGEGGTDPTIAILGNQVTGLSSDTVQKYFKADGLAGAYVLAPQTPTQWMDIGDGKQASSPENSVYTESLFKLIQKYVTEHDDVDANRIYIGGCSNGGWMTLELLADHGEYFAAAYPVSSCYDTQYITEDMINALKNIPIWFTHSKADATLPICETEFTPWNPEHPEWGGQNVLKGLTEKNTNELYIKLVNAGATNVYYSLFENVTVDGVTYDGHWSWIYTLRDECKNVQTHTGTDGALVIGDLNPASTETVKLTPDGEAVTLWGWIAAQAKTPVQA